jgi:hypothetical protein
MLVLMIKKFVTAVMAGASERAYFGNKGPAASLGQK